MHVLLGFFLLDFVSSRFFNPNLTNYNIILIKILY